jgi:hypothetical protein
MEIITATPLFDQELPVVVSDVPKGKFYEAIDWCRENIGRIDVVRMDKLHEYPHPACRCQYELKRLLFRFRNEEDALMFVLRFS